MELFLRIVKPFFANKSITSEKKIVGRFLANDGFVAKVLSNFFSDITKALGIFEYVQNDILVEKVNPLVPSVHEKIQHT